MSDNGLVEAQAPPSKIQQHVDEVLGEIINPLTQEREQLQALEADLGGQLADARRARQRVETVLRYLTPKEQSESGQSKPKSPRGRQKVADHKLDELEAAVRRAGAACSPKQIKAALDTPMADPTIYTGLAILREQQRIRAKPDPDGRKGQKLYTAYEQEGAHVAS